MEDRLSLWDHDDNRDPPLLVVKDPLTLCTEGREPLHRLETVNT